MDALMMRVDKHRASHLYRTRRSFNPQERVRAKNFSSNDYLGLSQHPEVIAAFKNGVDQYGVGGESSPMVAGYTSAHQAFEEAFADFVGAESALLFSSGYMANLGVLTVLANQQTDIMADKLIHASLIDAAQLSKAKLVRYRHLDYAHLERLLTNSTALHKLVVTDSVFSMHGDIADLPVLLNLTQQQHATLVVDDAHGIGVLGKRGAGISEYLKVSVPVLVCPLAKAFGVMGAMVAGSAALIDALVQFSRLYMYSNALPPAFAVAGLKSLALVKQENWRREKLQQLVIYTKKIAKDLDITLTDSMTPIQFIRIPNPLHAAWLSDALQQQGYILKSMRPPTVPVKDTCLRLTLTALHNEEDILNLLTKVKVLHEHLPH